MKTLPDALGRARESRRSVDGGALRYLVAVATAGAAWPLTIALDPSLQSPHGSAERYRAW